MVIPGTASRYGTGRAGEASLSRSVRACLFVAFLASLLAVGNGHVNQSTAAASPMPNKISLTSSGVDYYDPSTYFTHCQEFAWLRNSCWNNPSRADTARQQLVSDLHFVKGNGIGLTQRVWISLDQLIQWNRGTGFAGFRPHVLNHVQDMLRLYHHYGVKVILVLYSYSQGAGGTQFRPWAIDGHHGAMKQGYLLAERIFLRKLGASKVARETAPIIELQNEPYYQLEEYFNDPSHLGAYGACASGDRSDWGCIDSRIIHPWLKALYKTAVHASHHFLYTFSDTGRLFENYGHWRHYYPQDIIDEHLYDNAPWDNAKMYAQAKHFRQPWIATEVGCASGNTACTYGPGSAPIDKWWLDNLPKDGASTVLVECHVTLWQYPDGPDSQVATKTGLDVEATAQRSFVTRPNR